MDRRERGARNLRELLRPRSLTEVEAREQREEANTAQINDLLSATFSHGGDNTGADREELRVANVAFQAHLDNTATRAVVETLEIPDPAAVHTLLMRHVAGMPPDQLRSARHFFHFGSGVDTGGVRYGRNTSLLHVDFLS